MKTVTYKCDSDRCKSESNNINEDKWIEIGSDNDTLFINNYTEERRLISASKNRSIHFCCSKCLNNYLFL